MTLRVVELFSGIGAQRMALQLEGIPHEVVGISEIDEPALAAYNAIYGDCPNLGDITKVQSLPGCDLLTYSFPCQDLSIQGRRKGMGEGTRSGLVWDVVRLLEGCEERPEWLLMENVPLVLTSPLWEELLKKLEMMGYNNRYGLLDSSDFGSPQSRVRAFMISRRNGVPPQLPTGGKERRYILDILEDDPQEGFIETFPPEMIIWRSKVSDGVRVVADFDRKGYFETMNRIYSPKGKSPTLVKGGKDKKPKIMAGKRGSDILIRTLTPRECWRLDGFPDWAYDRAAAVSSEIQLYNQAGNSIVVDVLRSIFRIMFEPSETKTLEEWA